MRRPLSQFFLGLSLLAFGVVAPCHGDEPAASKKPAPPKAAPKEPAADKAEADPLDQLFVLPEGDDADALVKFIEKIKRFRPKSRPQMMAFREKAIPALKEAAGKVVKLIKDKDSEDYKSSLYLLMSLKTQDLSAATPAEKKQIAGEIQAFIVASKLTSDDFQLASMLCSSLEYSGSEALAKEAYGTLGKLFAKSDDEQIADQAKGMLGAARRMDLPGNPLVLNGTTLEGKKFDISSLKGKVVLVDFWATWCGPCRAEHPNIKANYEAYHAKGFEVVGVSIDQDRDALEEYVKEEKVEWITLHEKDNEGKNEATEYYGIAGIPCVILIDQKGNVVSLNVRGEKLGEELAKLLGEPAEKAPEKGPEKSEAKPDAPAEPKAPAKPAKK